MKIWHGLQLGKFYSVWTGIALILLSPVAGIAQMELELKEPESAEQTGKWDALKQEQGTIEPEPPAPSMEMER